MIVWDNGMFFLVLAAKGDIKNRIWEFKKKFFNCKQERKGKVLFNDALNTFYLRLYGVRTYGKGPLR